MPVSKNFELAQLANGLDVDQSTGEVITVNLDTDVVTEGSTNVYYTDARVATFLSGGTFTGGIKLSDNEKLQFGDTTTPDLEIYHDTTNSIIADTGTGNLVLDSETVVVQSTGALTIPVGTTLQQPTTLLQGMIRYNTDDSTFEGYDGAAWGSLGGVKDTDQDTYIEAEETADDDTLRFYTGGTERMTIGSTGNVIIAGDLQVDGTTTTVNSTTVTIDDPIFTLGGDTAPITDDNKDRGIEFRWHDGTANTAAGSFVIGVEYVIITSGDTDFTLIGAADSNPGTVFTATGAGDALTTGTALATSAQKLGFFGYDDSIGQFTFIPDATNASEVVSGTSGDVTFGNGTFDGTSAVKLPVGTTAQRPGAAGVPQSVAQGQIRYNTTDSTFEGYDGSNWGSLGGVKDVDQDTYITAEETSDDDTLRFYTGGTERMTIGSTGDVNLAGNLIFEGATADDFETTLTVTDPTADRTITFQDASGTVALLSDISGGGSASFSTVNLTGDIVFEGATADANETTLTVTDPTADRTITLPDASGTVAVSVTDTTTTTQGDLNLDFTLSAAGDVSATGDAHGLASTDSPTFAGLTINGSSIILEGATEDDFETTLTVTDPTADRTVTIPDQTGTVILGSNDGSGNQLVESTFTVQGNSSLSYPSFSTMLKVENTGSGTTNLRLSNDNNSEPVDLLNVDGDFLIRTESQKAFRFGNDASSITFEGATADDHETTLTVTDPTADRTITLPDATGTVILTNTEDSAKTITVIDDTASAFQFSATDKAGILKIDSTNTAEGVAMSGYLTVDGDATFNGNTTIGDANTDTVTFTAKANSSLLFDADGTYNIGDATNRVNEVHADYGEIDQWIDFGTGLGHPAHQEGRVWYDNIHRTLNYYSDDPNVVHELGIEEHQRVYNNTGSTILKGQPLYFSGNYVSGSIDVPTVGLADATDVNAYNAQGLAASDITTGSYGYCIIAGQLHGVDTSGLNAGTNFFVGLTPGAVQNASPTYPNYPMCLGWVVNSDATNGVLLVNQQNHSVNSFRVRTSAHIGSDLQVDGDLTVLGTTTSVSTADVTAGAPFYRANEGDSIGEAGTTFIGTGLDDAFFSGHFTGTQSTTYYVRIDSVGTPDTFEVSLDNFASTLSTGNAMTGSTQLIHSADNIYVEFGATTGHTLGDVWQGTAGPTNVDTGFFSNRNTGTSGVGYTHVGLFFDVSDEKWKLVEEYDPTPQGTINTGHASFNTGTLVAGAVEANVDWSYIQNKPDPIVTTTLTGTVTGTGNATLTDLTNGTISIATSIPGTTNLTLADLTVTNLTVTGTQTINNQTNLTSDDPLFVLNQSQNGEPDIGMIGGYTENSTAQYTGFFRDASDNKWKLFDGYTPNVTSTGSVNVSDASFALTTLAADTFEGNLDWSYIQNKPDPVVTVTLTGEVTGTGNATLTDLASGTISITTNIDPNSDVEVNDLTVTGDLNVQGTTTTVNQTTLTVTDSKIFLADGNNADVIDIGTIFEYNDGSNDQSAGLFRDANDSGKFKFFDTYTLTVGTTIDTGHASFSLGTVVADTFEGNFTGTLTGNISGTATSAATLTTPRNLWGQSFDGSADVSGNLTSVGNITGTSAVEIIAGGTNQNIVTTPSGTGYTILGGNVGINQSVPQEKLHVEGAVRIDSAYNLDSITVASLASGQAQVETLGSATTFRTAKLLIQSRDLTTGHTMISEVLLAHDGTTVHQTVYGEVNTTTAPFATYDCSISGGNINIQIGNSGSNAIKTTITTTMVLT